MEPKSSSGAGGLRESLRERFWRVLEGPRGSPEAPQERPRSAQERPRRPKMSPRRPNMSPRRPQMTPRRVKMSPRRAKVSSGRSREASGSDLERISEAFSSNALRPRRSQLKPPARARSARARLQAGAAARMFSQPSSGSSQKAPKKTHEKLTAVPRGALPCFFSPLLVLVSSSSPSLAMLAALASHALPVPR